MNFEYIRDTLTATKSKLNDAELYNDAGDKADGILTAVEFLTSAVEEMLNGIQEAE